MLKQTFKQQADLSAFAIKEPDGTYRRVSGDEIIQAALLEVNARFSQGTLISSPQATHDFLKLQLAHLEHEMFAVLWLDNRHRVLAFEELFRGTIEGASVYPREVVKSALQYNAAACILCHNHPSGVAEPSESDKQITKRIKQALQMIDVRTLDHIVVAKTTCSFAERGLL